MSREFYVVIGDGRRAVGQRRVRAGVSLLEILIAIFVLSIGLLGVAAVIPAGRVEIVEAGKADRSAACGHAALREVKVRGMLDPTTWVVGPPNFNRCVTNGALPFGRSYAIDPLFVANTPAVGEALEFPYKITDNEIHSYRPKRITLDALKGLDATVHPLPAALADRIFRWADDLVFTLPKDPNERPQPMMLLDNGKVAPWPESASPGRQAFRGEGEGRFSWLMTVIPEIPASYPGMTVDVDDITSYTVSIVVFHNRDLSYPPTGDVPAERWAMVFQAGFAGAGLGGGDVVMCAINADWLEVKENDWVMLFKHVPVSSGSAKAREIHRWYRIVAVGPRDSVGEYPARWVTLAGPDWTPPADSDTPDAVALFTGIVGVYTTTIEVK